MWLVIWFIIILLIAVLITDWVVFTKTNRILLKFADQSETDISEMQAELEEYRLNLKALHAIVSTHGDIIKNSWVENSMLHRADSITESTQIVHIDDPINSDIHMHNTLQHMANKMTNSTSDIWESGTYRLTIKIEPFERLITREG